MNKNTCQCVDRTLNADRQFTLAGKIPATDHRSKQLPSVLRYRGLENEAVEAARVIKIETLMTTLLAALDDLDLSVVDFLEPDNDAEQVRQG